MKNKIALFFLVTSLSMATTPVWAGNGVTSPSKSNITLDKNNTLTNSQKEEKSEEKGSWFTKKNVGIGVVIILIATSLMRNYVNRSQSNSSKK